MKTDIGEDYYGFIREGFTVVEWGGTIADSVGDRSGK